MSNVGPEKAIYKPGDIRLDKQMTLSAGNAEDTRRQAST